MSTHLTQRRRLLALIGATVALPSSPWAAPGAVSAHLAQQARAVVQAQLDAFAADDAARAFSYATPAIRKAFGEPGRFIEMVKINYPVVYRPTSVTFLKAAWIAGQLSQGVRLSGITRHMLGLYAGRPGARQFRRHLSQTAHRPGADGRVLMAAMELAEQASSERAA